MNKKKICFVSLYAYSLFNRDTRYIFGGSEVRAHLFSVELGKRPGLDVSLVTAHHGQKPMERFGAIRLFRHSHYTALLPDTYAHGKKENWSRAWLVSRWDQCRVTAGRVCYPSHTIGPYFIDPKKLDVYKTVDADIYCVFGVSNFTAEVALFCKLYNKKLMLFIGHDWDLSEDYFAGSAKVNSFGTIGGLCRYAIDGADLFIAQTETQKKLLAARFRKNAVVIRNPVDQTARRGRAPSNAATDPIALWIGKSNTVKQPYILLRLADEFPDTRFVMTLNNVDDGIYTAIVNDAPPNVEVIERLPYNQTQQQFENAFVFVNTSEAEGFPNTFLQAGAYGVPVLTLNVDPDGFITREQCGVYAYGLFDKLVDGFRAIRDNYGQRAAYSRNIARYVRENHDIKTQTQKLAEALDHL